ncbi:hypothetical protein KCP69_19515 [Salmonella enterica subsp. enterica]|nr:hypothetical protein KCP69_19515 [Salmonella enterica subsp. enterica]
MGLHSFLSTVRHALSWRWRRLMPAYALRSDTHERRGKVPGVRAAQIQNGRRQAGLNALFNMQCKYRIYMVNPEDSAVV